MDDLALNIFSNARKSRASRKEFDDVPCRDSQSKLASSKRVPQSTMSISKNLEQPKSSQAFNSLMRGIADMGRRIDEKYSSKKIESTKAGESKKWRGQFDKIKEQKNEDEEAQREDKAVGTSAHYLDNPYLQYMEDNYDRRPMPIRIISPEGSRLLVAQDNSRIIFPPPIVQVRPLSTPKPVFGVNPEHFEPMAVHSRIIINEPVSPHRLAMPQPIIRRNVVEAPRTIEHQPHPHPQSIRIPPSQQMHRPMANLAMPNQPAPHHPPNAPHPQNWPNMVSKAAGPHSNEPSVEQQRGGKAGVGVEQGGGSGKAMSPQQYEALLQKQYQLYSSQNSQLLKHLSTMSEEQKRQQLTQQALQESLKNGQSVRNVVNEKKVTRIVEKNVINKENICHVQNSTNVHSLTNQLNAVNMSNVQNLQHLQQFCVGPNGQPITNEAILRQLMLNNAPTPSSSKRLAPQPALAPVPVQYRPLERTISEQRMCKQLFAEGLKGSLEQLDGFEDALVINSHIADLNNMKKDNYRDGLAYLRKMDDIIEKYGRKPKEFPQLLDGRQSKQEQPMSSTIMNRITTIFANKPEGEPELMLVQSRISPYPETHELPQPAPASPHSKHFLSLTKDMVFDFFSGLSK